MHITSPPIICLVLCLCLRVALGSTRSIIPHEIDEYCFVVTPAITILLVVAYFHQPRVPRMPSYSEIQQAGRVSFAHAVRSYIESLYSCFYHVDIIHLAMNVHALWTVGYDPHLTHPYLEQQFRCYPFAETMIDLTLLSHIFELLIVHKCVDGGHRAVGFSGAIYGLLTLVHLTSSHRRDMYIAPGVSLAGVPWLMQPLVYVVASQVISSIQMPWAHISFWGHLGGAVAGVILFVARQLLPNSLAMIVILTTAWLLGDGGDFLTSARYWHLNRGVAKHAAAAAIQRAGNNVQPPATRRHQSPAPTRHPPLGRETAVAAVGEEEQLAIALSLAASSSSSIAANSSHARRRDVSPAATRIAMQQLKKERQGPRASSADLSREWLGN